MTRSIPVHRQIIRIRKMGITMMNTATIAGAWMNANTAASLIGLTLINPSQEH